MLSGLPRTPVAGRSVFEMLLQSKISVTAEKIVEAAGRLFARHGYHGTTTREIAHLAMVSENTLFRHFDRKEDLFWSALRSHCAGLKMHRDLVEGIARCDGPEVVLPRILEMLEDTVNYRPELIRLVAVAFLEMNTKAAGFCVENLSPALSAINCYLAASMRQGKIRELESTMVTSALIMTALTHPAISNLIDGNKLAYSNCLEAHRAQTRFWLDLLTTRIKTSPSSLTHMERTPSI
jgi:AcrR family transcriptional regulator